MSNKETAEAQDVSYVPDQEAAMKAVKAVAELGLQYSNIAYAHDEDLTGPMPGVKVLQETGEELAAQTEAADIFNRLAALLAQMPPGEEATDLREALADLKLAMESRNPGEAKAAVGAAKLAADSAKRQITANADTGESPEERMERLWAQIQKLDKAIDGDLEELRRRNLISEETYNELVEARTNAYRYQPGDPRFIEAQNAYNEALDEAMDEARETNAAIEDPELRAENEAVIDKASGHVEDRHDLTGQAADLQEAQAIQHYTVDEVTYDAPGDVMAQTDVKVGEIIAASTDTLAGTRPSYQMAGLTTEIVLEDVEDIELKPVENTQTGGRGLF